jgi:DNA-binding response OmpR family regulator
MDGYEVCKRLKADESTKDIPVIFLTARVQKEDIIKGFELGAVDYVIKPFSYNELNSRIKTHIELREKSKKLESIKGELESIIAERTLELKLTNDELQSANKKLLEANKRLEKFDKSKNEFVLLINHELRTPLNGILGQVNILKESLHEKNNLNIANSI